VHVIASTYSGSSAHQPTSCSVLLSSAAVDGRECQHESSGQANPDARRWPTAHRTPKSNYHQPTLRQSSPKPPTARQQIEMKDSRN